MALISDSSTTISGYHFNEARGQIENRADDMVLAAEKELRDTQQRTSTKLLFTVLWEVQ